MKLKQMKVSLWHRYILYYYVIFIIPFIILAIFVFKFSLERVEEKFDSTTKSSLNQSKEILLSQIKVLDNVSMEMAKDSYISQYIMEHDYYGNIGKEMISRYISSQLFIDDIILFYFSGNEKYYSSKGSYNEISVLKSEYYKDVNISKKTLKDMFYLTTPQIITLPVNNKNNTGYQICYIFPIYDSNGRQSGTTTFLFNEEKLKSILPKFDKDNRSEVYITNNSDYVLLSNTGDSANDFIDEKGRMFKDIFKNNIYKTEHAQYRITKSSSDELGLKFISILDSKDLVTSLINTKMYAIKLLTVLFLIGLLMILVISYIQYMPIKRIHRTLSNKNKFSNNDNKKNELENIERLIINIIDQNEELAIKNEELYHSDKNKLLLELIEGVSQEKEDKKIHPFILDLESQGHSYYIMLLKKSQLSRQSKLMIHKILTIEKDDYMTFTIQIPFQDKIGVLVVHKDINVSIKESLKDIEVKLESLGDDIYFYCGQVYEELSKINHSYIEAMIACDYIINDTKNKSIIYRETNYSNGYFLNYPSDSEEKLAHGLKQGTQEVVSDSINQIFDFINSNKYYHDEIKVYSFYLINFIVRNAAEIDFPHEDIDIKKLVEYSTLEELKENLLKLVNKINEFVLSKRNKVRDEFKEGIFKDILEGYTSHDLSLELLSQKYGYSLPYLSKMIKEETGMTFTKYIQELRLNYVKEKLVETDLSIKEIIFQAGYYDISNFSRKFKNITGVTPGQYRELNKKSGILDMV